MDRGDRDSRLVKKVFDFLSDLGEEAEIGVRIVIARFEQFESVELGIEDVGQKGGESVGATSRLTADCCHHELHVLLSVATRQYGGDDFEDPVVQTFLHGRERDGDRLRLADGKFPDIAPPRPIDGAAKG